MTQAAQKFIKEALSLPAKERAEVAEQLLMSLETPSKDENDIETAWQHEIDKRYSEIVSGKIQCIPWEEVRAKLMGTRNSAH